MSHSLLHDTRGSELTESDSFEPRLGWQRSGPPRRRYGNLVVVGLMAVLVAASCSTTAHHGPALRSQNLSGPGPSGSPNSAAGGPTAAGLSGNSGLAGPSSGLAGPSSGLTGPSSGNGVGGSGSTSSLLSPSAPAHGSCPGPAGAGVLSIGVELTADLSAAGQALGVKGAQKSDEQGNAAAVIKYINSHGGIACRQVQPVYHTTNFEGSDGWAAEEENACADFTQDHHVFAVLSTGLGTDDLAACLTAHHTPLISTNYQLYDNPMYSQYRGYLFQPAWLNADRAATAYVAGLEDQGFFPAGSKIGLLRMDAPVYQRVMDQAIKPALAKKGLSLADVFVTANVTGASSLPDVASQAGSAVLRFQSEGINRVLFDDYAGTISFFFMDQAENQGYRPRYGIDTLMQPTGNVANNAPHNQLLNTVGVGWIPTVDNWTSDGMTANAAFNLCTSILTQAGYSGLNANFVAYGHCDGLYFLKDALERLPTITVGGLQGAAESLGTAHSSALTFMTRFGPGRDDGAAGVRYFSYNQSCGCFKYSSSVIPIS